MKRLRYFLIDFFLICSLFMLVSSAKAAHFEGITPTRTMVDFIGYITINGKGATVGDEIGVFDDQGLLVGKCEITKEGQYGVLHVYGQDIETEAHDGANPESILTFKLWLADSETEINVTKDMMSTQTLGSFVESLIPPRWTADMDKFVLDMNIDTTQQRSFGQEDGNSGQEGDGGIECFISCLRKLRHR